MHDAFDAGDGVGLQLGDGVSRQAQIVRGEVDTEGTIVGRLDAADLPALSAAADKLLATLDVRTVSELIGWLAQRGETYAYAFETPRVIRTAYDGFIVGAFTGLGFEILEDIYYALNSAPDEFGAQMVQDVARWSAVVQKAGVQQGN